MTLLVGLAPLAPFDLGEAENMGSGAEVAVPAIKVGADEAALRQLLELPVWLHYATRPAGANKPPTKQRAAYCWEGQTQNWWAYCARD